MVTQEIQPNSSEFETRKLCDVKKYLLYLIVSDLFEIRVVQQKCVMAFENVACPCQEFTIIYQSHTLVLEIGNQIRFRAVLQQTK